MLSLKETHLLLAKLNSTAFNALKLRDPIFDLEKQFFNDVCGQEGQEALFAEIKAKFLIADNWVSTKTCLKGLSELTSVGPCILTATWRILYILFSFFGGGLVSSWIFFIFE